MCPLLTRDFCALLTEDGVLIGRDTIMFSTQEVAKLVGQKFGHTSSRTAYIV